jgi:uncharacterized protein
MMTKDPGSPDIAVRHELIDALRGFALFGVLMVNLVSYSMFEFLDGHARALLATARWDAYIEIGMEALVDAKSITLFSLLFGVGFAIQMQKARMRSGGVRRYARRMLILLLIGLGHAYLLWWGDILRYYAVLGLLLLLLDQLAPRVQAGLGLLIAVVFPVVLQPLMANWLPVQISSADSAAAALSAFGSDQIAVVLQGNLERDLRMRFAVWFLVFFVLGRLLIGAAIGRSGALQHPLVHQIFWRQLLLSSLLIGASTTLFLLLRDHVVIVRETLPWLASEAGKVLVRLLRNVAPLALGLAYMAGFVVLYQRPGWERWLRGLVPLGRMALTHYLAQTAIGILLFYGIGLDLGPRYGLVGVVCASIAIFAAQIALSHWWMRRYHFGPAEWLWRSLTVGMRQPFRRQSAA